ncbi:hypothetical protein DY000_02040995 [Brassica cretica]|uniref:Chlorophyll a-b binding protein, chloroplastic n=1 Tax=Brassica cretica TaxID=69181 RepID=A0ABQ7BM04_BRACR|nr:hypothetical protein DY000_02040995 [Brassica cretica]
MVVTSRVIYSEISPKRGNAALPPPPKRLAITPCAFAVGDPRGAERIAGFVYDWLWLVVSQLTPYLTREIFVLL